MDRAKVGALRYTRRWDKGVRSLICKANHQLAVGKIATEPCLHSSQDTIALKFININLAPTTESLKNITLEYETISHGGSPRHEAMLFFNEDVLKERLKDVQYQALEYLAQH
ncbi:hypothetical protein J6590_035000 [Homalodisca vitripennis]|nr:hypothetical protein J6590_035000 [Homalodisca vitripennis]